MTDEPCPISGCRQPVRAGRLFCEWHWAYLPGWLKTEIVDAVTDDDMPQIMSLLRAAARYFERAGLVPTASVDASFAPRCDQDPH